MIAHSIHEVTAVWQLKKIIVGGLLVIWSSATILLLIEYRFFKEQAHHLERVQNEYRNHVQTVKTIIDDYAKTKERLVLLEESLKGEKKNPELASAVGFFGVPFPEGVKIHSSDDQELAAQDSFLVVNRELEYLKEAAMAHIRDANIERYFKQADFDELRDYTERVLAVKKHTAPRQAARKPAPKVTKMHAQETSLVSRNHAKKESFLSWPIDRSRFWLSSSFGPRRKKNGSMGFHQGIDMAALKGTSVMAAAPGVVVEARYDKGYGNTIVLAHNNKYKTRYAHLHSVFVHRGQRVQRGALIGTVGNTGYVRSAFGKDPSHLHFELYVFGTRVNPMHFLV